MIVQLLIAYGQNKKKSSDFLRDAIATLTGFKPALDAYEGVRRGEVESSDFLTLGRNDGLQIR